MDAGIGVTWARIDAKLFKESTGSNGDHWIHFIQSIGYRRHAKNDVMWRANITPIVNKEAFTPCIGFAIGKHF